MATRSVSFGDVEEQIYEEHQEENYGDELLAEDYFVDETSGGDPNSTAAGGNSARSNNNKSNRNAAPTNTSSLFCPNCGGKDIEQHDASGASVCTSCGVVVCTI